MLEDLHWTAPLAGVMTQLKSGGLEHSKVQAPKRNGLGPCGSGHECYSKREREFGQS